MFRMLGLGGLTSRAAGCESRHPAEQRLFFFASIVGAGSIGFTRRLVRDLLSEAPGCPAQRELALYQAIAETTTDAHSRYNALIRRLVSFECALEARSRKVAFVKKSKRAQFSCMLAHPFHGALF